MNDNKNQKKIKIDASQIPLESSLGLLAYGDIAFMAWKKIKEESIKKKDEEK